MPRPRFTLRWLMVAVASVGVLLSILLRMIQQSHPPTRNPVEWARQKTAFYAPHSPGERFERFRRDQAKRYAELAESFYGMGIGWEEETRHGPYTDKLETGQSVQTHLECRTEDGRRIWAGTAGVVGLDRAREEEDCHDSRLIAIRLTSGPLSGTVAHIERIRLRRSIARESWPPVAPDSPEPE